MKRLLAMSLLILFVVDTGVLANTDESHYDVRERLRNEGVWLTPEESRQQKAELDRLLVSLDNSVNSLESLTAQPITVQINGSAVNAPADMDMKAGQVMVPIRWAAERLGASALEWDPATRTITIKTPQDFYSMEKLASYANALQLKDGQQHEQVWTVPDRAKELDLSYAVTRKWELELPGEVRPQPADYITIRIVSDDGTYEHSSVVYSAENRHGSYFLPMDWLEYLFNARVNYNQTTNVFSIQPPDLNKITSDIALIEDILIPTSADEAIKIWGRGEQTRNGGLQYLALSPQLRQEADKSNYVRQSYWVTGGSSPRVGPITIVKCDELNDAKVEYTISFPEITSTPPYTTATEKLVVEKMLIDGQEGWFITEILQSSGYGIIDDVSKSNRYENNEFGFSLLIPPDFMNRVEIKEGSDSIYFVNKEIQAMLPEQIFGVVGRIEIYDKEKYSSDIIQSGADAYGLRYLGENENYYFGYAYATDVQVPPDAAQGLIEQFRSMEEQFEQIIKTFSLINTPEN